MIIFFNWISWRLVGLGRTAVRQSTSGPTTIFSTIANRRGSKPPIPIVTSSMIRPLGLQASGFPRTTLYCTNALRTRRTSSAAIISRWECRLHLSELFKSVSLLLLRNLNFSTDLFIQGNRRTSSRVMLTLYSVNMKSVTHPCADRLIFRDFKNDLTILDVNANRLKATGNYTSTRGKGYLCQLQFQVEFNTIMKTFKFNYTYGTFYFQDGKCLFTGPSTFVDAQFVGRTSHRCATFHFTLFQIQLARVQRPIRFHSPIVYLRISPP